MEEVTGNGSDPACGIGGGSAPPMDAMRQDTSAPTPPNIKPNLKT